MLHLTMKMKISTVALAAMLFVGLSLTSSFAQVGISIGIAPPPIPIYEQPLRASRRLYLDPGLLGLRFRLLLGSWRLGPSAANRIPVDPGYWGYNGGNYFFNEGYWGPTRRVLRRDQLRLRLRGTGLLRRPMGRQYVPL